MIDDRRHDLEKALALLRSMAAPHETGYDEDHRWRQCRRCLAMEEASTSDGHELMRVLLAHVNQLHAGPQPSSLPPPHAEYLGDGVYVTDEPDGIILQTTNGLTTTNTIVLNDDVIRAWFDRLVRQSRPAPPPQEAS